MILALFLDYCILTALCWALVRDWLRAHPSDGYLLRVDLIFHVREDYQL